MTDLATLQAQDNYSTRIAEKYSAGGASMIMQTAPSFTFSVNFYITVQPGTNNARSYLISGISGTTLTISGSAPVASYEGESPTSIDHSSGVPVVISNNFKMFDDQRDAINSKVDVEGDTMTGKLQFSGTTYAGIQHISLTTTERLALTPVNGDVVYDETIAIMYQYVAGAWKSVDTGTSVGAATTTALGTLELATATEVDDGTTSGTEGVLAATPDLIAGAVQDSAWTFAADAEASDAYAITIGPAAGAYVTGQRFTFTANTANTGPATLNVSALGAKAILRNNNVALVTGDIEAGQVVEVVYDGTQFQMVSTSGVDATESNAFFASTDITGAEAETLSDGSNADSLHLHNMNYKVGSFTYDTSTASGTQAITGVGFQPEYLEFSWGAGTGASGSAISHGNGAHDGTANMCTEYTFEAAVSETASTITTHCISIQRDLSTSTSAIATVTTLGSDGFTLTWTKSGSPTGTVTIFYKAFKIGA